VGSHGAKEAAVTGDISCIYVTICDVTNYYSLRMPIQTAQTIEKIIKSTSTTIKFNLDNPMISMACFGIISG